MEVNPDKEFECVSLTFLGNIFGNVLGCAGAKCG